MVKQRQAMASVPKVCPVAFLCVVLSSDFHMLLQSSLISHPCWQA